MDNWYHARRNEHVVATVVFSQQDYIPDRINIKADEYAHLSVVIVQKSERDSCSTTYDIEAAKSSVVSVFIVQLGSQNIDCSIQTNCVDSNAHIDVKILYLLNENQTMRLETNQSHAVSASESSIVAKGVLYDASQFNFSGLIAIGERGKQTQAQLFNKSMMLSDNARVMAQPQLEVLTDDVSCAHGTASGYPDDQDVYYMQSRGMSFEHARSLLVEGFINEITDVLTKYAQEIVWQECKNKLR